VLGARWPLPQALAVHALSQLGVRPEDLELLDESNAAESSAEGGLRARISLVEHLGDSTLVHLVLPAHGTTLAARLNGAVHRWQTDQWVCLRAAFDNLHPFDAQGRRLQS
jgi:ABC-type sugar transport system ATPase subunit